MILAERKGITQMANRKLHANEMKMVHGKSFTKSPIWVPFIKASIGKNMQEMEQVAMSMDDISSLVETAAEYHRE